MRALTTRDLSLNTATVSRQWSLPEAIEGAARHGFGGVSPWRDKLHETGVATAARHVRDAGLSVSGLCRGGWYTAAGALTQAVRDDNRRAIDEAAALGADCLVMVVGGLPRDSRDLAGARALVAEGLADTLEHARATGVPVAIEPLHPMYAADRACVNTLGQALDLCDALGPGLGPGLGVALDVYHVWWDPALAAQIARAGDRLLAFHVCDWLDPTRDLLTDRGMMGAGVVDIPGIRGQVEAAGYAGLVEVEIFSALDWWARPGDEVLAAIVEALPAI